MSEGKTTTDHDEIRQWAEERGGMPATVKGTGSAKKGKDEEPGILRLDFEPRDAELEEISWDEFFEKFDKEKLAFLYQDETSSGKTSRFHKFVNRPKASSGSKAASGATKSSSKTKAASGATKSSGSAKSSGGTKAASGGKSTTAKKTASK